MNELTLHINEDRRNFRPHENVDGTVAWTLDRPPERVEVQLLWTTRGKGAVDTQVVDSVYFEPAEQSGERQFKLRLKDAPYSFTGRLVSVIWCVRATARPQGTEARANIVVSPTGQPIELTEGRP